MNHISVLDKWQVWSNHLRALLFSIVLFSFYGAYLWIVCSSSPGLFTVLLLLLSQLAIGVPACRAYHDLGAANRAELGMFDSAVLRDRSSIEDIAVSLGQIPFIFERLVLDARKSIRTAADDYTDISWFLVSAWATVSSGLYYFGSLPTGICLLGDGVLAVACALGYFGGYWMTTGRSFEDDLDHLEYYVLKRLKVLDSAANHLKPNVVFLGAKRGGMIHLVDFVIELRPSDNITAEYHMGLPSNEAERFVLEAPEEKVVHSMDWLRDSARAKSGKWLAEKIRTPSGLILRFVNESQRIDLTDSWTYLRDPGLIEASSREFEGALLDFLASLELAH